MVYIFTHFAHDFTVEEFTGEVRIYGLVIYLGLSSWRGFPRKTGSSYLLYRETFMLNWLVPAWVGSRYRQCYLEGVRWLDLLLMDVRLFLWLSIWLFGGYISFVGWLLMCMYFDKPRLKGINASRGQAALICKDRNTAAGEIHKTANWSLLQGEEEVNKRIKQKIYI